MFSFVVHFHSHAKRFTKILAYFHQAYLGLLAHSDILRVSRMFLAHTQLSFLLLCTFIFFVSFRRTGSHDESY